MYFLSRVLSALAHWSPIFGETSYLPLLAFPFVKLFQNNQLVCFEIVATILSKTNIDSLLDTKCFIKSSKTCFNLCLESENLATE